MANIVKKFTKRIIVAEEVKYYNGVIETSLLPNFEAQKRISLLQIEKHYKDLLGNPKATIIVKEEKNIDEIYEMTEEVFKQYATLLIQE